MGATMGGAASPTPGRRSRVPRWMWICGIAMGAAVVLAVVAFLAIRPLVLDVARAELDSHLAPLSEALGRKITIGGLSAGITEEIVLTDLRLPGFDGGPDTLVIPVLRLGFSPWDILRGKPSPDRVVLERPTLAIRLDGATPTDLKDLADGFQRWRARRGPGGGGGGATALPEVEVTAGTVLFLQGKDPVPTGRLTGLRLDARHGDGALEADLSATAEGLGVAPTSIHGVATYDATRIAYASLESDAPIEWTRLLGARAPLAATVEGAGVDLDRKTGRLRVTLKNLRSEDATALLPAAVARWFPAAGPVAASEVRIEVDAALLAAAAGTRVLRDALQSVAIRGARARLTPSRGAWSALVLEGVSIDLNRDPAGTLLARVSGGTALGAGAASRFGAEARLGPGDLLKGGALRLSGPMAVQALSLIDPHVLPWPGADVDLDLSLDGDGTKFTASGRLSGSGLAYFWTKICLVPVTDLAFSAILRGDVDLEKQTARLVVDPLTVGRATFSAELGIEGFHAKPRVSVRFTIPRQPCQWIASAIPLVMVPRLEGMAFQGSMEFEIRLSVDMNGLEVKTGGPDNNKTVVKGASLSVDGDFEACEARTLGRHANLPALDEPFVHVIPADEEEDAPAIPVGPGTPSYVALDKIPEPVWQAALATEDMGFFQHEGFKLGLIKRAIVLNLDKGWYVYGGSTISQQLVKNLFLSREKTLSRKLEEAIIVWQMERRLTKERILELYLNCIEYGKRIYGIKAAALAYFNRPVEELTPLEGAFLMATKPAPSYAYGVYEKRQFSKWWVDRMHGILVRLWKEMKVLDEAQVQAAAPYLPLFWYPEDGVFAYPSVDASVLVPEGMPRELPKEPPAAGGPDGEAAPKGQSSGAPSGRTPPATAPAVSSPAP